MPDSQAGRPRILIASGGEEGEMIAQELASQQGVELVRVADRTTFESELARSAHVVVLGASFGLGILDAQAAWRSRGMAPQFIVFARTFSSEEMQSVMEAGAVDYVTADQRSRLSLAV
jgi:hypothetical protein